MSAPADPKIYHIIHVDRLSSVIASGGLLSDRVMAERAPVGTTIGMNDIKRRRLTQLRLDSHAGLHVGECVPFYFCPRSVMLYVISRANHPQLAYHGGQSPIVHLEADLHSTVEWAEENDLRWAFTLSNAGAYYFEDRAGLEYLDEIDWDAVAARDWRQCKEGKQAEFLVEDRFSWELVSRIGVQSNRTLRRAVACLDAARHRPVVQLRPDWYY